MVPRGTETISGTVLVTNVADVHSLYGSRKYNCLDGPLVAPLNLHDRHDIVLQAALAANLCQTSESYPSYRSQRERISHGCPVSTVPSCKRTYGTNTLFYRTLTSLTKINCRCKLLTTKAHTKVSSECVIDSRKLKQYKKAVLPQGNRAMPQVFFSVEVRQQHSLQV